MKKNLLFTRAAALLAAGLLGATTSQAAFTTTGVYDENTVNLNAVDVSATSDAGVEISLSSFTALVELAYNADAGGVINFDSGSLTNGNTLDATYGVSAAKNITITNGTAVGTLEVSSPVITAISGNAAIRKTPGSFSFDRNDFKFDFNPNDGVKAVGASIMSQFTLGPAVGTVSARVFYDDSSSSPIVSDFISNTFGSDDTFWGFQAPAGRSITRFELLIGNDVFAFLDDLAFVLDFTRPRITGDLDGDGFVGISDLNLVLGKWNQTVKKNDPADPSGDSFVGIADLNMVLGNWNAGIPPATGAALPEPGTGSVVVVTGVILLTRRGSLSGRITRPRC